MKAMKKLTGALFALVMILVLCSTEHTAAVDDPVIQAQPEALALTYGYTSGGTLSVVATEQNGTDLTYQWYQCNDTGKNGAQKISNATATSYDIPTGLNVGRYYYYCDVTATPTGGGESASATSNVVTVMVDVAVSGAAKTGESGSVDLAALIVSDGSVGAITSKDDNSILNVTPQVTDKKLTFTFKNGATAGQTATVSIPVTSASHGNYSINVTLTVSDKTIPIVSVDNITAEYSGAAVATTAIKGTAKDDDEAVEGAWSFAADRPRTNVADSGIKMVVFKPNDTTTYGDAYAALNLTITPKEVGLTWSKTPLTYNGSAQKPTATATGLAANDTCTVSVTGEQTNAGDNYTATASALSNGNYKLPANNTHTFAIAKAKPVIGNFNVTLPTELTYDGQAKTATAAVKDSIIGMGTTVTVQYQKSGDSTMTKNAPKDAGTYKVLISTEEGDNYTSASSLQYGTTFTITPKEVGLTWDNTNLTYNGQSQAPTAAVTGVETGDDCDVTVSGAQTNARTTAYTATAALTGAQKDNYALPSEHTTEFTIAKADQYIELEGVPSTPTIGDVPFVVTATGGNTTGKYALSANPGGYVEISGPDSDNRFTITLLKASGDESVSLTLTKGEDANHKAGTATESFKIFKDTYQPQSITVSVTAGTTRSVALESQIKEGGQGKIGEFTDSSNVLAETPTYDKAKKLLSCAIKNDATQNSIATITVHVEGSINYADYDIPVIVKVQEKGKPSLIVKGITKTYDGKPVSNSDIKGTATFNNVVIDGTWEFVDDDLTNVFDSGMKTVKFTPKETTYSSVTAELQLTILQKPVSITGLTISKTYDGTVEVTNENVSGTAVLSGVLEGDTVTLLASSPSATFDNKNAGENKTVALTGYSLSDADAENYTLSGTVTGSILPKLLTVSATAKNRAYDPDDLSVEIQSGILNGTLGNDDIELILYNAKGTLEDPNAGTGKTVSSITGLYLGGKDSANYSLPSPITGVTVTITPAAHEPNPVTVYDSAAAGATKSVELSSYIATGAALDGESITVTGTGDILDGAPAISGTKLNYQIKSDADDAGIATITIPVKGAANYEDYNIEVSVDLRSRSTQNPKFFSNEVTKYYGDPSFVNELRNAETDVTYVSSDPTVATVDPSSGTVTVLKPGTTKITATAARTSEYAGATASYDLTVEKRPVTVKAIDQSVALDGETGVADGTAYATLTNALDGHTLSTVTLTPSSTAAVTSSGTITPSEAAIQDSSGTDVTANYNIKYETGTLRVTAYVKIEKADHMTLLADYGEENQTGLSGSMTPVAYEAADGYYFPSDYKSLSDGKENGIKVVRNSGKQITIFGAPRVNVDLKLDPPSEMTAGAVPEAVFTATGADSGTLTGVEDGMRFSLDGGQSWKTITGTSAAIASGVTTEKGIQVYRPASGVSTASSVQTISVTRADKPALTATACKTESNDDGAITGLSGTTKYEYKSSADAGYTAVKDGADSITGLAPGTYQVRVRAGGTVLASEAQELTVAAYEAPPVEPAAALTGTVTIGGTAKVGETLSAELSKDTNNTGDLSYQWKANDEEIPDATGKTYTLTGTERGKTITCTVRSSVQTGSLTSEPTAAVAAADVPEPTKYKITVGTVTHGKVSVDKATAESGETVTVTVTPDNGYQLQSITTDPSLPVSNRRFTMPDSDVTVSAAFASTPLEGTVSITGHAVVGQTLTASLLGASSGETLTYQWKANGAAISGATDSSYTIKAADAGKTITCTVTGNRHSGSMTSAATVQVSEDAVTSPPSTTGKTVVTEPKTTRSQTSNTAASPNELSGAVSISGTAAVGQTLTAVLEGVNGSDLKYRWVSDGRTIPGAWEQTYTVTGADVKRSIAVIVTSRTLDGELRSERTDPVERAPAGEAPTINNTGTGNNNNTSTAISSVFYDIAGYEWFADSVEWAYRSGVMVGTSDHEFSPRETMDRATMTQIIYNYAGAYSGSVTTEFSDVSANNWYGRSVTWAVNNGIARSSGGYFGAKDDLTREDMVTMLYNYARLRGFNASEQASLFGYDDSGEVSDWARSAMAWAVRNGLINGVGGNKLAPRGTATRAQLAAIMQRFSELYGR